jgi:NAD(P)-dependent dehydrogenase (short-subunit alcohol dehydrogenase family)
MFDLTGKTALVTGAGQNVGEGIATALAQCGAAVIVNDYHLDRADRVAQEINDRGGSATAVAFDVTELGGVRDAFAEVADRVGPVDILVNNAGTGGPTEPMRMGKFVDLEPAYWNTVLDVNLVGVLNCCKFAVPPMLERGWGRVITMSSGAGQIGMNIGVSLYAAAKAGAIGFTRHLAIETARQGVTREHHRARTRIARPLGTARARQVHSGGPIGKALGCGGSCRLLGVTRGGVDDRPDREPQWRRRHELSDYTRPVGRRGRFDSRDTCLIFCVGALAGTRRRPRIERGVGAAIAAGAI